MERLMENEEIPATTEMTRYTLAVPGINTCLEFVDFPGFLSTMGVDEDARVISNIHEYLKSSRNKTRLILVCVNFQDNRYDGQHSLFVQLLTLLEDLKRHLNPMEIKNIIWVFTHY
jgi:hypothetical protein